MVIDKIALALAIIGALNWGGIGLFGFDTVAFLCGGQMAILSRIIYALVGVLVFAESLALGKTLIAGAFTLVIMTLPTVIRTTQESLKTVQRPTGRDPWALAAASGT